MTNRYDLLINSIATANTSIVQMFLFALIAVIAYPVLEWTPAWMRRPAKALYLVALLCMFLTTVFYSAL
jgi:hypothetical protein